ncbi:MAG: DUF5615 family PIN-like protein [Chloroflexota bacterium]
MKIKLDENLPIELCNDLRALGHDADTVLDEGLAGSPDSTILERVQAERRTLWTMDKGIADVRQYPPHLYDGIVLFRPNSNGRGAVLAFVRQRLSQILEMDLVGRLLIISDQSFRLR